MTKDDKDAPPESTSKPFEDPRNLKPSSTLERDAILEGIGKPELTKDCTPGGETERLVHKQLSEEQKLRLKEIESNLKRAREQKDVNRRFQRGRSD